MKFTATLLGICAMSVVVVGSCSTAVKGQPEGLYAEIRTDRGGILLRLEAEKAPLTVTNFVGLAEGTLEFSGRRARKFYDGLTFHRVLEDVAVQGGDPAGDGSGGPGYSFPDEFHPELRHDRPGILSMANVGPDTNGSQFYITRRPAPELDRLHVVFGRVIAGQGVVDSLRAGDVIRKVRIHRVGKTARAFRADQQSFDRLVGEVRSAAEARRQEFLDLVASQIRATVPGVITTPSGLMYKVLEQGSGDSPRPGQEVKVRFTARFLDGTAFDSSYLRGGAATFTIGQGISGWNEALPTMKRGEKRVLFVPPDLAYGRSGEGGVIPPDSFLVFEVELLDF